MATKRSFARQSSDASEGTRPGRVLYSVQPYASWEMGDGLMRRAGSPGGSGIAY